DGCGDPHRPADGVLQPRRCRALGEIVVGRRQAGGCRPNLRSLVPAAARPSSRGRTRDRRSAGGSGSRSVDDVGAVTEPAPDARRPSYDLATERGDYPDRDGPPNRTLLVCCHPRSGSTLLGEAIFTAGGLGCPLEYLHRGFRPAFAARWKTPDLDAFIGAL